MANMEDDASAAREALNAESMLYSCPHCGTYTKAREERLRGGGTVSAATPEGWERIDQGGWVEYESGSGFRVRATCMDVEVDVTLHSASDRDALISIVQLAWNQHVYLKAHPDGPVLDEDKEMG